MAGGAHAGGDVEGKEEGGADAGFAEAGEEHAQVGGDFGGGADGGAEGAAHGGLVDDDGGGEVEDVVDVGAGELGEEAAGEGAEGFDPLALGFGVKGVEDEGGFAGAGDAGDGDELVLGDVEVEALEVVGAGAADLDEVGMDVHGGGPLGDTLAEGGAGVLDRGCESRRAAGRSHSLEKHGGGHWGWRGSGGRWGRASSRVSTSA